MLKLSRLGFAATAAGMVALLSSMIVGCQKAPPGGQTPSRSPSVRSGSARDQRVLDYLVDNKKVQWSQIGPYEEFKMSPTGESQGGLSNKDESAFFKAVLGRSVPDAVRALVRQGVPATAAIGAGTSSLTFAEAQKVIGKEDSSRSEEIHVPSKGFVPGTWHRYGAIDIGVDEAGLVKALRVDLTKLGH
jgi:hypothetical protein